MFEGAGAVDSFLALIDQVAAIDLRLTQLEEVVENLTLSQEGWQEQRIQDLETTQQDIINGDVTFEKVNSKANVTAYVVGD